MWVNKSLSHTFTFYSPLQFIYIFENRSEGQRVKETCLKLSLYAVGYPGWIFYKLLISTKPQLRLSIPENINKDVSCMRKIKGAKYVWSEEKKKKTSFWWRKLETWRSRVKLSWETLNKPRYHRQEKQGWGRGCLRIIY